MTIAERWARDAREQYGDLHAKIEKGVWVFYLSDGKEKVAAEDYDRVRAEIAEEKRKPFTAEVDLDALMSAV